MGAIPKAASDINHLTWAQVHNAPYLTDILPAFLSFIGQDILIGYNIEFDIKFIQTRSGQDIANPAFDVLPLARATVPTNQHRLENVRRYFGLPGTAHTAIGDCITTALVFQKCRSLPEAQKVIQERIERADEERRIMQAERDRIDAVLAKKAKQKENLPSAKELRAISAKMTGLPQSYFKKVEEIVLAAGLPWNDIHESSKRTSAGSTVLYIKEPWIQFFGVKLTGNFKYIILDLPPESVNCDFICGPSSLQEGDERCRIYVPSPNSLDEISEYIIASYNHAKDLAGK